MTRIEAIRQNARTVACGCCFNDDVEVLLEAWDTRDAALRALVAQWKARAAWHGAHGETPQQGESEYCIEALSRLLEHEP